MGRRVRTFAAVGAMFLAPLAFAGDVVVEVVVAKRLTKRSLTPPAYNLRGAVPPKLPKRNCGGEFNQTVVILEGGQNAPSPPQTLTIEQRGGRFDPGLVVVPIGSTVHFPNFDPIFHNVFSLSRAQKFDLGFYPKDHTRSVKFQRAGIVQVYCHIHARMYAAIVVTSSPWFGKPGEDGTVAFHDVPPGHYKVMAWHKAAGMHQVEVEVPATGESRVRIQVPVDREPGM